MHDSGMTEGMKPSSAGGVPNGCERTRTRRQEPSICAQSNLIDTAIRLPGIPLRPFLSVDNANSSVEVDGCRDRCVLSKLDGRHRSRAFDSIDQAARGQVPDEKVLENRCNQ